MWKDFACKYTSKNIKSTICNSRCNNINRSGICRRRRRKYIAWYLKGLEGSTKVKDRINRESDIKVVKEILKGFLIG